MFNRKLKRKIQELEAKNRGLCEENQRLTVAFNDANLQVNSLKKALKMYQEKEPIRDAKGRFTRKKINEQLTN